MSEADTSRPADHDSPWKMALEGYFQEFLGWQRDLGADPR